MTAWSISEVSSLAGVNSIQLQSPGDPVLAPPPSVSSPMVSSRYEVKYTGWAEVPETVSLPPTIRRRWLFDLKIIPGPMVSVDPFATVTSPMRRYTMFVWFQVALPLIVPPRIATPLVPLLVDVLPVRVGRE